MNLLSFESLAVYWSGPEITTNLIVALHLLGALMLGLLVGYERSYHGRAAGMRTYGLVCMASTALTVIAGYPDSWFGGQMAASVGADPTRIIQGVVTGIGFLGAGVIMREGMNISGLTTAASIWASAAIGVMIGVGFFAAGIMLALLSAGCMVWGSKLESWLPSRQAVKIVLRFKKEFIPREDTLRRAALKRGYEIAGGSLSIIYANSQPEWHFVAISLRKQSGSSLSDLAAEIALFDGVDSFQLAHARN